MRARSWCFLLLGPALIACSGDDASLVPDAGSVKDATVADTGTADQESLQLVDTGCPKVVPGAPCTMANMQCAAPPDCEACGGGFVLRAATCFCGAFWTCDQCGRCGQCDAGQVYGDPACSQAVPPVTDAGIDSADAGDARAFDAGEAG